MVDKNNNFFQKMKIQLQITENTFKHLTLNFENSTSGYIEFTFT